jgi:hypothetical protein
MGVAPSWAAVSIPVAGIFAGDLTADEAEVLAALASNLVAAIDEADGQLAARAVLVILAAFLTLHTGRVEPCEPVGLGLHCCPLPEQTGEHFRVDDRSKVFDP